MASEPRSVKQFNVYLSVETIRAVNYAANCNAGIAAATPFARFGLMR